MQCREAIRHLIQEGLVVSELNRSDHVRPISPEDVIDVYVARQAIEVAAMTPAISRQDRLNLGKVRSARHGSSTPPPTARRPRRRS